MSDTLSQADLLALYDHDERIAAVFPDTRREEVGELVRHLDVLENSGLVAYSRLDETSVEAAIQDQMAYFAALGWEFEWKTYSHDRPADLIQRLAAHGFQLHQPEAILVLDLQAQPDSLTTHSTVTIKRVEQPAELAAITPIKQQVDCENDGGHVRRLQLEMEHDPSYVSVYLAYVGDVPSACGWIRYPTHSAFASLWGGSTVPTRRGQGLYTALLAARVTEARQRGARYLTVDARSMSRPILERRGFRRLTTATACVWSPNSTK
jgi:GNAT superfamily N-acetyltransferase